MKLWLHSRVPEDTRQVLAYTREHFGQLQAERYAELIIETQRVLLEQPTLGRRRDDVVPGSGSCRSACRIARVHTVSSTE